MCGTTPRTWVGLAAVLLCLSVSACSEEEGAVCGNGSVEAGEACDFTDFAGATCGSLGFDEGTLSCTRTCEVDTTGCMTRSHCETACDASACQVCDINVCVSACEGEEVCEGGFCRGSTRSFTIFYTSDEHGWMAPEQFNDTYYSGYPGLMTLLRERGYEPGADDIVLLSGGDSWTGPALSTWFQGESMVEVMNAMGYSAAALGNHEFDFGPDVLAERVEQVDYPILSANVLDEASGERPAWLEPFTIIEADGVSVGLIGLTVNYLDELVMSSNLDGLVGGDYEAALREVAPLARAAGAEMLIVIAHVCGEELLELTPAAADLEITAMLGGHCHNWDFYDQDGVVVIDPGAEMIDAVELSVQCDIGTGSCEASAAGLPIYTEGSATRHELDAVIAAIIDTWSERLADDLGDVIGYTEDGVEGWALYNLVVDAWLWAIPEADMASGSRSGHRGNLSAGEITAADIVAALPFENFLYELTLTGEQVFANADYGAPAMTVGGITIDASGETTIVTLADGSPLDLEAEYTFLTTDYIYDQTSLYKVQDPTPIETGIQWRNPVIDWIRAQNTTIDNPIDDLLDTEPRVVPE